MAKITRRDLFKLAIGGGTAITAANVLNARELIKGGKEVSRTTGKYRKAIPSTCLMCYARCGIVGFVESQRLVKIGGNPAHPNSRGRMCAKGQAGVNFEYDPERILKPLKRTGSRGDGKWKEIPWDEALNEIAGQLNEIKKKNPAGFVFYSERDITTQNFVNRFMNAFGSPSSINLVPLGGLNKMVAHRLTWGEELEINDVANTRYILNFGSNPYEAHLLRTSFVQRITEGRTTKILPDVVHYGAKMVTFDVRVSQTAGKSDEWHPIRPGTDGIVALAMANVIMRENLHDRDFIERWTNYPAEKLKKYLKQFTPELAQKISGVPAEDIRRIAIEFANSKPATTISTGGITKHANGVQNERCIMLLNIITGNIDLKGGYCIPRTYTFTEPEPVPKQPETSGWLSRASTFALLPVLPQHELFNLLNEGKNSIDLLMTYSANPAYSSPENRKVEKILIDEKIIKSIVVIDSNMSETAKLADIVLPEATYLERWEIESPPSMELIPFVSLRQPVIQPLGEARAIMDILISLSRQISGMDRYLGFGGPQDYIEIAISKIPGLQKAGGLDYLKEYGVWYNTGVKPEFNTYKANGFNTDSRKIEIYSTKLEKLRANPLPSFDFSQNIAPGENELQLIIFQWNVHTHYRTANCKSLSEIVHTNPAWINKNTAELMGIKEGDNVEISSPAGSIITKVTLTEGIHPKSIAIGDSCGHWEFGHIARSKKFRSIDPETKLLWWENEGNGVHPKQVILSKSDPIGGGQAWMDTVVKIKKV